MKTKISLLSAVIYLFLSGNSFGAFVDFRNPPFDDCTLSPATSCTRTVGGVQITVEGWTDTNSDNILDPLVDTPADLWWDNLDGFGVQSSVGYEPDEIEGPEFLVVKFNLRQFLSQLSFTDFFYEGPAGSEYQEQGYYRLTVGGVNGPLVQFLADTSQVSGTTNGVLNLAVNNDLADQITFTAPGVQGSQTHEYAVAGVDVTTVNADLSIMKTDSPDPVTVGQTLTYTITVTNNGPDGATGVTMTDILPGGVTYGSATPSQGSCSELSGTVTCNLGSLANGASATITILVTPTAPGTITNTATVTGTENDPNTANNNTGPVSTTVNPIPPPSADLSITKTDSPDPVTVGQTLTYTITVTNNGPSGATGVTVTDTLPGSVTFVSASPTQGSCTPSSGTVTCNLGSLANGASAIITIQVTPTATGTITNSAIVTGNENDPNTGNNNTGPVTTTVDPPPPTNADVSITKADSPDPVPSVGQNLTYTITVTNNGPATATGVVMTDTLPSTVSWVSTNTTQGSCSGTTTVTCNLGTLNNGASATITIVVMTGPPAGMIGNTASVTSNENDPNTANNSVLEATNVGDVSRLINISTRGPVLNSPNLMHGGFVFGGNIPKTLLIRGRGPSIGGAPYFVPGTMSNPKIELYSGQTMIAQNDNWQTTNPQCDSPLIECFGTTEIVATGKDPCQPFPGQSSSPPGCAQEAVLLVTLPPGPYTVIMSGVAGSTGVGIIEVFDPDSDTLPKLANISTRGTVLTSPNFMHGGFIIGAGTGNKTVLIRGRGPALAGSPFFVPGTLSNPKIELYSGSTVIAQNDNWQTTNPQCDSPAVSCGNAADIVATGRDSCQPFPGETSPPPGCAQEAAILVTLPPGPYTVIMSGVGAATGTGLIEVFELGD